MGELTTSLAHEINQPLTAILSNAEAAQRFLSRVAPDFGEVRQILEDIIRDDRRASDVVRKVRALVKKEKPAVYVVDDDSSVRKALKRLLRSAGYHAVTFESAEDFIDSAPEGGEGGHFQQPLSLHGHVLAHARVAAHRA